MNVARFLTAALGFVAAIAAGACQERALTPEQANAKGDAMLRRMSQTLAAAQAFSFATDQMRQHVHAAGGKTDERFTRRITVRRPNAIVVTDAGGGRDGAAWYDGKRLTFVSNRDKAWARGPMPPTLDEAMDFVSAEYALQLPIADLIYSNPYDAVMTKDTTGGWVNTEAVGSSTCEHLSYQQPVVDWQIWLSQDEHHLPCQLQITYKTQPGQPMSRVTFSDWNLSPQVSDATFEAKIPDGYERLKIMRHGTVEAPSADASATPAAQSPQPK